MLFTSNLKQEAGTNQETTRNHLNFRTCEAFQQQTQANKRKISFNKDTKTKIMKEKTKRVLKISRRAPKWRYGTITQPGMRSA